MEFDEDLSKLRESKKVREDIRNVPRIKNLEEIRMFLSQHFKNELNFIQKSEEEQKLTMFQKYLSKLSSTFASIVSSNDGEGSSYISDQDWHAILCCEDLCLLMSQDNFALLVEKMVEIQNHVNDLDN